MVLRKKNICNNNKLLLLLLLLLCHDYNCVLVSSFFSLCVCNSAAKKGVTVWNTIRVLY